MKLLDHPNITKLIDYGKATQEKDGKEAASESIYIAMELVSGGELFDFIA